ncbi:AhpA/YtjB family protein [Marinomonas sp. THO17]|uniref:AhpA/YtjB family protein n=1 Tax=Marinomonas sp. THO17 TaxID=3149048 RepID=UPI00336BB76E
METLSKKQVFSAFVRKRLSAATITVTTFLSLMVLTVFIFWYTMAHALGNYLNQQTEVLGSSLATQAAFNATQSILTNDLLSLNVLLNRLVVDENILSARVYNKKDELLAEADSSGVTSLTKEEELRPNEQRRVYSSSIKFRDEIVGHVLITLDRTPAQATLQHLNHLLIGVAIFVSTIALLLIVLITRWLFNPINDIADAMVNLDKKQRQTALDEPIYKEARQLHKAVTETRPRKKAKTAISNNDNLEISEETETKVSADENKSVVEKAQFEINFDAIFEESKQRSCLLYFDILNLDTWRESLSPLQVANLLTPIYRAMFQASETYLGQVHQYQNDAAIILFSAEHSEDSLYINAISTAQLFIGLVDKLYENALYEEAPKLEFHLGLHQGNVQISHMIKEEKLEPEKITKLLEKVAQIRNTEHINKLVITDDIFTLSQIQNRVFTSLPDIIEDGDEEILAYEVKGMSDKYTTIIQQHISDMTAEQVAQE